MSAMAQELVERAHETLVWTRRHARRGSRVQVRERALCCVELAVRLALNNGCAPAELRELIERGIAAAE